MECDKRVVIVLLAIASLITRIGINITSPLMLDTLSANRTRSLGMIMWFPASSFEEIDLWPWRSVIPKSSQNALPTANFSSSNETYHEISPYFMVLGQWTIITLFFSVTLGIVLLFFPSQVTEEDRKFPKRQILFTGAAQGVSSTLVNFGYSGQRTPPYLQAILANFNIPMQFFIRFLILHKRPTWFKLGCALTVLGAEFVCLLPTIFPQLESSSQHHREGGATGVGRILYPMLIVCSGIPYSVSNSVIERGVQQTIVTKQPSCQQSENCESVSRDRKMNIVYFMFWWSLFNTLTILLFFWVDVVPIIGTSHDFHDFFENMMFGAVCSVGGGGCGWEMIVLVWVHFLCVLGAVFSFNLFLRYSEGANFVIITLSLRTPLMFLFWTLFNEVPFYWSPHLALSTWLSLGGLAIMIPAVILYNTGAPEIVHIRKRESEPGRGDRQGLLAPDDEVYTNSAPLPLPVENRLVN